MKLARMQSLVTFKKKSEGHMKASDYELYPICSSSFGSFPCFRCNGKKMDNAAAGTFDNELSLGSLLYFKQLKNAIFLLISLAIINLPLLILNQRWGTSTNTDKASNSLYKMIF